MANSNKRVKEYETVHHLVSRIAHRVYFLKEDERKDFLEIVRRAAEFTGIRLIGWCVMGNHFHVLAYLPSSEPVDEDEILRRYGILKGKTAAANMETAFADWRKDEADGERRVSVWLDSQRSRMYSIASFMKIVKQWFTVEYNKRNAHKGTLWEAAYFDRVVARNIEDLAVCLGYIHLNPIRAAETDRFDGYLWSSYSAFCKGDPTAVSGMRFVYGDDNPLEEIRDMHEGVLETLLEKEKLRRAEEIARRRAVGYEIPPDPLTTEAMVAQQTARLKDVQKEALEFREKCEIEGRSRRNREYRERELLALLGSNPEIDVPSMAERMSLSTGMVYALLRNLKKRGVISQAGYCGRWLISK